LCVDRDLATPLEALGATLLSADGDAETSHLFATTLGKVALSLSECFPDNIFWDLDYVANALWTRACEADGKAALGAWLDALIRLHQRFGVQSEIRFRYGHDFYYGYDWVRWVDRAPDERRRIGPFERSFLTSLYDRGGELLQAIEDDEAGYPRLPHGATRNTFPWSREPRHERLLFEDLAKRELLPLAAWEIDAQPRLFEPFSDWRKARAEALSIPPNPSYAGTSA
jgi:hypothetical protein